MTNPTLNNEIGNTEVILWQYDKAWNLIRLIENWNKWAKVSCQDFWDKFWGNTSAFQNGTFFIDSADTFGLNVWGNLLGIPRPTIRIPVDLDSNEGGVDYVTIPSEESDSNVRFDEYGYDVDGYRVSEVSQDGWKTVTIKNTLYRGLLKGRFFMMCKRPTVPNYNKFLAIVFGAIDTNTNEKVYNIYNEDGKLIESDSHLYRSRNKALDFMNMTMGFTFPENPSTEEAYLIFQHYDLVYPFPAGIRYAGEFIDDELVIGLNTESQNPVSSNNQNYKNFVDGLVLAEDPDPSGNPNGGILSTTDRSNYKVPATITGEAYIVKVEFVDSDSSSDQYDVSITFKSKSPEKRQAVWIDWGNGLCGYNYLPAANSTDIIFGTRYTTSGLYPILVLYDDLNVEMVKIQYFSNTQGYRTPYALKAGGAE